MTSTKAGQGRNEEKLALPFAFALLTDREYVCMYACPRARLLSASPGGRTLEFSAASALHDLILVLLAVP